MFGMFRPGKFLLKLILSFSALMMVVTLALSALLYGNFKRVTLQSIENTNGNYLNQISYSANYMNDNAINLLWNIYLNPRTVALMYQDANDYDELYKESIRLTQVVESNPFVHSIYVYNRKLNRYLGTGPEKLMFKDDFFDGEAKNLLFRKFPVLTPQARSISEPYRVGKLEQVFTYLLYEYAPSDKSIDGAVILNVKAEYLQQMTEVLKLKSRQEQGEAFVMTAEGKLVSQPMDDNAKALSETVRQSVLDESRTGTNGHFTMKLNDGKYMISYVRSSSMDWYYVLFQPYPSIISSVDQIRNITLRITIAALLIGLAGAIVMSRRLHYPLERLLNKTIQAHGLKANGMKFKDEIRLLDQVVSSSYGTQKMEIRKKTLRALILKGVVSETHPDKSVGFKVDFGLPVWVILIRMDHYKQFVRQYSEKERDLLRYSLTNVIQENFAPGFACECVDVGEDLLCGLVQIPADRSESAEEEALACLRESQTWCESHLRISFSCFQGEAAGAEEIPSVYRTLQQLSYYRFIYGSGTIARQTDIDPAAREEGKISAAEETELMDALNNGQLAEAKQSFKRLMDRQKKLKYESMMTNLLQVAYVIYNRLADLEDYGNSHAPIDINQSLKELLDAETADEWRVLLEESFVRITTLVKERKEKRSTALADSAIAYIHLHYRDPSLCLESISDHLKYSKVYLSKVFRETAGQSVAEYITEYRIAKVIEEMGSVSNIDELLERNGIENKKYFYTLFKRKMGVSIREYRTKAVMQPVSEDKM